ncbi:hypothetical protein M8J77_017391 [Diaphorina citri]|nr:hypothetical protein M8J77_017391 [Diaphorina citri]
MNAPVILFAFLLSSTYCLTLPSIKHYLLTHKDPADLVALEYASKNITDEPVIEINEPDETPDTQTSDEVPNLKQITLESSEVVDANESELDRNVSEDRNGTDSDKLADPELRIKVPVMSYDETPKLPQLSLFKPALESFSLFSKPKPLNGAIGSGIKTVYVRATKTVKEQPMCITVYGLKPPCSSSNSFNQGYYGFKRDLEDAVGNADLKDNDETQQGSNTSNSSTETGPSAELRSFAEPLMTFPTVPNDSTTARSDDVINDEVHSNPETSNIVQRQGKYFMFMNHHAKSGDTLEEKILPNKPNTGYHVVTETIYTTKVLKQYGATATLVVENCVPINTHIPFCGNIYPIYQVPEVPTNYFHVPIPVLQGKFPVDYKPNYQLTARPPSPFEDLHKPLTGFTPINLKLSPQKFPPTSLLQSHVPGFLNRISNVHTSLSSAACNSLNQIGKIASLASQNAVNLANSMHSHLHQHKLSFLGHNKNVLTSTHPKEDIEGSASDIVEIGFKSTNEDIKPVKEEQLGDNLPEQGKNYTVKDETSEPPSLKTIDHVDEKADLKEHINVNNSNSYNTTEVDSLNEEIVKKLSEVTLAGNTHNHTESKEP